MRGFLVMASGIDKESAIKALDIMWKGLLAILVVIVIVMAVTWIMQAVSEKIAKSRENCSSDKEIAGENRSDEEREL